MCYRCMDLNFYLNASLIIKIQVTVCTIFFILSEAFYIALWTTADDLIAKDYNYGSHFLYFFQMQ